MDISDRMEVVLAWKILPDGKEHKETCLASLCSSVKTRASEVFYVPSSQEFKYFTCSGVKTSMAIRMASSFKRAISLSISSGME